MTRPGFFFDPERCTGCQACRLACDFANGENRNLEWRKLFSFNPRRHPHYEVRHFSLACNHCDDPACLRACPAAAYSRDPTTGAVLLDEERCLGCRYCAWVCPYAAPRFDTGRGLMTKCTFCTPRLAAGRQPACTEVCPTGALALGTHAADSPAPRAPGLPPSHLGPALAVPEGAHPGPPAMVPEPHRAAPLPWQPVPPPAIRPAAEWTLVILTLVLPLMAAWFMAGLLIPARAPHPVPFLVLGIGALVLSGLHLGRPTRAWRSVAGWRTSWLSLEILAAGAFLGVAGAALLFPSATGAPVGWLAAALGVVALLAVDGVYGAVPRLTPAGWHGGEAMLTGGLFLGLGLSLGPLTVVVVVVKGLLAARRAVRGWRGVAIPWFSLRLALLAVVCLPGMPWAAAMALAAAGELIERISFYAVLEPASPAGHMAAVARSRSEQT